MFSIIGSIIIGLIVGVLARFLLPGKEAFPSGVSGVLLTALLGIAGAFLGTFVGRALGFSAGEGEVYSAGWIMSILGAILLLVLVRLLMGRREASI